MSRYWFLPKTYGYGATPSTWEGWVATLVFAVVFGALTIVAANPLLVGLPADRAWRVAFGALAALALGVFMLIAAMKTDGGWGWRWGE